MNRAGYFIAVFGFALLVLIVGLAEIRYQQIMRGYAREVDGK